MAITQLRKTVAPLGEKREHEFQLGRFLPHAKAGNADIVWHAGANVQDTRRELLHQRAATLWMTGLSGAGKSTIAYALEQILLDSGHCCVVLDGDNIRHHLNSDLGFSADDRRENIRRAAEVAHLMNEAGLIVLAAFISPLAEDRAMARSIIGEQRFLEVYVDTSIDVCEQRDPKGLYAKARSGKIPGFTGVSAPYQAPDGPGLRINTESLSADGAAHALFATLADRKIIQ